MPDIVITNVPYDAYESLWWAAKAVGKSVDEHLRDLILTDDFPPAQTGAPDERQEAPVTDVERGEGVLPEDRSLDGEGGGQP